MKLRIYTTILSLTAVVATAFGGAIDDARKLYRVGEYQQVIDKLQPVVKKTPKDGNATFYLGASLYALGRNDEAVQPLTMAESRGVADASRMLAEMALERYDADGAGEHLDRWQAQLKKQKKDVPAEYGALTSRAVQMSNMLQRVERIEVLDSIIVSKNDFFTAYRLSPTAGRILPADAVERLGAGSGMTEVLPAYMPENNSELLWSAAGEDGVFRLYGADILDDGTLDHSAPLDDSLGQGGDAAYPFLMPDGMTLYFANNGENSLGGYDIFMTRRNEGGDGAEYFQPQNIGMPYNSPYDDYMLAIDEASGLGWWATDRNQLGDKLTIYIFAPSAMRVNADPSDPSLGALARLSDISLTQKPDTDYKAMLADRLPADRSSESVAAASPSFALDMGNGKVYTRLSDFRNDRARSAMLEVLSTKSALRKHLAAEDALREKYRRGDRTVSKAILESERETARLRKQIETQQNTAVRLETR